MKTEQELKQLYDEIQDNYNRRKNDIQRDYAKKLSEEMYNEMIRHGNNLDDLRNAAVKAGLMKEGDPWPWEESHD